MSHRAIQRLRQERQGEILPSVADGDDSDEDDTDEDDDPQTKKAGVFAAAMFDSDSDDDSDDESDDDSDIDSDVGSPPNRKGENDVGARTYKINNPQKNRPTPDLDDLDAILQEYKLQDSEQEEVMVTSDDDLALIQYSVITSKMEIRDFDVENVRRSLFGGAELNGGESGTSSRRNYRNNNLFGAPSDNWSRPPHYLGGGIGFKAYSDSKDPSSTTLPWPYCDMKEGDPRCPSHKNWFQFIYSDSYRRDFKDMQIIRDSGDANAILLFVTHHPFVVEALLQTSIVMYQMNQGREGLSFLKRALWIFECAAPNSFLKEKTRCAFMDYQKDGNKTFFSTLFRLIRVSYVGGLARTAFAVSQFLLSLDPLRDPMNILLGIDHFAIMCNTESSNTWLVNFVESEKVRLEYRSVQRVDLRNIQHYSFVRNYNYDLYRCSFVFLSRKVCVKFRDSESQEQLGCQILDLPNWGFSYALALFNLYSDTTQSEKYTEEQINKALKTAICRFPFVVGQLLAKNGIDATSRSFRTDWPAALKYLDELEREFEKVHYETYSSDTVTRSRILQVYGNMAKIFVQQNFKLWSSSKVLTWVYNNLIALRDERKDGDSIKVRPLSPAIIRYINSDPTDFEDKFQTMPADANPFDPNVVALALNVDPNRRRLVQRNPRHAGANFMDENGNAFA